MDATLLFIVSSFPVVCRFNRPDAKPRKCPSKAHCATAANFTDVAPFYSSLQQQSDELGMWPRAAFDPFHSGAPAVHSNYVMDNNTFLAARGPLTVGLLPQRNPLWVNC